MATRAASISRTSSSEAVLGRAGPFAGTASGATALGLGTQGSTVLALSGLAVSRGRAPKVGGAARGGSGEMSGEVAAARGAVSNGAAARGDGLLASNLAPTMPRVTL